MSNTYYNTFRLLTAAVATSACLSACHLPLPNIENTLPNLEFQSNHSCPTKLTLPECLVENGDFKFLKLERRNDGLFGNKDTSQLGTIAKIGSATYFTPARCATDEINLVYYGTYGYNFRWGHCKINFAKLVEESDSDSDDNCSSHSSSPRSDDQDSHRRSNSSNSSSDSDSDDDCNSHSSRPYNTDNYSCAYKNEKSWDLWSYLSGQAYRLINRLWG